MDSEARRAAKDDLRWKRTEKRIVQTFVEELAAQPLKKITVTHLAEQAGINKATFYLHYYDIYDLADSYIKTRVDAIARSLPGYDEFFEDPVDFVEQFLDILEDKDFRGLYKMADANQLTDRLIKTTHKCFHERYRDELGNRDFNESWAETVFLFDGMLAVICDWPDVPLKDMLPVLGKLASGLRRPMHHDGKLEGGSGTLHESAPAAE